MLAVLLSNSNRELPTGIWTPSRLRVKFGLAFALEVQRIGVRCPTNCSVLGASQVDGDPLHGVWQKEPPMLCP